MTNRIKRELSELRDQAVTSKMWASRRLDEIAFERKKLDDDEQDKRRELAEHDALIATVDEIFGRMGDATQ